MNSCLQLSRADYAPSSRLYTVETCNEDFTISKVFPFFDDANSDSVCVCVCQIHEEGLVV